MELSTLKFVVDTTELDRASKALGNITQGVAALNKAAKEQAQTEATLSRAAKDQAKANLDNAKAQDIRLKSTIAADEADQRREKSVRKVSEATERASKAAEKNVTILQRQSDILEFQTQGWSKGQASILATAKAAKVASDEMEQLMKVLDTQRKLMGTDPFDKSNSGLKSLTNQYREAKEALRQYNSESGISSKQTRELARDKERLIVAMKSEGASFSDIRKAVRQHNEEYVKLAGQYNNLIAKEAEVIKQRKEVVSAARYVETAEQKMAAALNITNSALDKAGTDSLVKYENALKRSGLAQDVVTQKLAKYRTQLAQVQSAEEKRKGDNLSRALSPQLTDVAVSLYSGQAPLTVLLQQGGQILDLFKLSGIEAQNFGKAMREAFSSMIPAMATVAKGIGSFVIGSLVDAGAAVTRFVSNLTGISTAVEIAKRALASGGEENFKYIASLQRIGAIASGVTAVGIAALTVAAVAAGVALYQVIQSENELSKSLALNAGSLGLSKDSAVDYAKALSGAAGTTGQFMEAIDAMAKAGVFTRDEIAAVATSAVQMAKYFDVAMDDTVKSFAKLKEDPVKNLIELAKQTGLVTDETIKAVIEFQKQGQAADATALAIKTLAQVNSSQVELMKKDYNQFSLFIIELGGKIKQFFSESFASLWRSNSLEAQRNELNDVEARLQKLTNPDGSAKMFQSSQVEALRAVRENLLQNIAVREMEQKSIEDTRAANSANARVVEATTGLYKQAEDAIDKQTRKIVNQESFRKQFVEDKLKDAAREKNVDIEQLKRDTQLLDILKQQADIEYKKMHKSDNSKSENYYATLMREATNATISATNANNELTKSEQKLLEVKADPRFQKLTETQKAEVVAKYEAAAATEKLNQVEELREKLLGKSNRLGQDYYDTLNKIVRLYNGGNNKQGIGESEFNEMLKALNESTPAARAAKKELEEYTKAVHRHREAIQGVKDANEQENTALNLRAELLGKTSEEQRELTIEYERQIKVMKALADLRKQLDRIDSDPKLKSNLEEQNKLRLEAEEAYAERIKNINRDAALKYREDLDKEFRAFKEGIADSIVTSLFEGGKAGSKKLRETVIEALKKPVTIVVNALVNGILNNIVGSFLGGDGASSGGGGLGGLSNLFSTGKGIFDAISKGFSGLSNDVAYMVQRGLNFLNPSSALGAPGGTATMIGQGAGVVGGALAGRAIGQTISGGYSVIGRSGNTAVNAGTIIGTILGGGNPLGGIIGGAVGGLVNRLFGRKLKEVGIEGTFGGSTGFEGRRYEFYKGGTFRSDKTKYSDLDEQTRYEFAKTYKDLKENVTDFAKTLGLSTDALKDFVYNFKVNLKDLSPEDAQKAIAAEFEKMGIAMADLIFGIQSDVSQGNNSRFIFGVNPDVEAITTKSDSTNIIKQYQKAGESSLDTLTRLASSLKTANEAFKNLGITLFDSSLKGADFASKLVDEFGDLEKFASSLQNYYTKFYSDYEQQNNLRRQVDESFKKLGVSTPKTRDEFRRLVEAQDLTTEAGRHMFASLMELVDAFDLLDSRVQQIADSRADLNQRILDARANLADAQGNSGQAVEMRRQVLQLRRSQELEALKKLDPELANLATNLYELEDATEVANKKLDLEQRLLVAQGKESEIVALQRRRELEALQKLDPALVALAEQIYKLEDAAIAGKKHMEYVEKQRDLEQRLLTLQGKDREALDKRRLVEWSAVRDLNPELAKMLVHIYELEDALEWRNKAYDALEKAVEAEKTLVAQRIETSNQIISSLTEIFDILKNAVDSLYGDISSTSQLSYIQARQNISAMLQSVSNGGSVSSSPEFTESIQTAVSGLKSSDFSTKVEFDRQRLILAGQLSVLKNSTKASLTVEEKILEQLKEQDKGLDETLKYWKTQIEIANGTYEATLSVAQAVNNLISVMDYSKQVSGGAGAGGGSTTTPSTSNGSSSPTDAVFGGSAPGSSSGPAPVLPRDDYGRVIYPDGSKGPPVDSWFEGTTLKWAKLSPYNPANAGKNLPALPPSLPGFAQGGYYSGGLALVGEQGPELINFRNPGQVYTNSESMRIMNSSGSSMDSERLERLLAQVVENTKKTSDTLRNVTPGGDSVQIESSTILTL